MTDKLVIEVGFDVRHWRTLEIANPPAELLEAVLEDDVEEVERLLDVLTLRNAVQVVESSHDDSPLYLASDLAVLSHSLDDTQLEGR